MRNLKLLSNKFKNLDCLKNKNIFKFCIDCNTDKIYILFDDGITSSLNTSDDKIEIENFHFTNSSPICLTFLSLTSEISVIDTESVSIFDQDLNLTANYTFASEIIAAEYSPAQDLLALVTKDKSIQLLTQDPLGVFSILSSIQLHDHKIINQSINVGWGSKETQFHGSEGKDGRKKVTEYLTSVEIGNGDVNITWRGDGLLFAVCFLRGDNYAFVVLDNEGVPKYSSEFCKGLEAPLCWKPSGNLIVGVQSLSNKYQIVFFEKNGLRHGEFTIDKRVKVKKLSWSSDSEILCILYENNQVDLWTANNYHWYLKQSLVFNATTHLNWDSGFDTHCGKVLYALCNQNLITYEWVWITNHSIGLDNKDLACVGVIDGSKALITSFKKSIVPPPMSACTLVQEKPVNMILFGELNNICVIQNDYTCYEYTCLESSKSFQYEFKHKFSFNIENKFPLIQNHFLWVTENIFLSFGDNYVLKYVIQDDLTVVTDQIVACNETVINLERSPKNHEEIFVQTNSGNIYNLNISTKEMIQIYKTPSSCYVMKSTLVAGQVILFILDRFNRFYVNDACIANNITSFYIHSSFLLLTTSNHYLICAPLKRLTSTQNLETMNMRRLERGTKIVCAVQQHDVVILQMPRGNLETIKPRPMSIQMVGTLIDAHNYLGAFTIMKIMRLNLNLLYDYKPEQFIENIGKFVEQLECPIHLCMFLMELQDVDIIETMYSTCFGDDRKSTVPKNKRTLIADKLLEYLSNNNKYLLTIVTAYYVKHTQNDLEKALDIIFNSRQINQHHAEKALDHLLLLIPINDLYNLALGMYNFELILFVAAKSQKDPKEYIPFLNELNKLEENYKRFSIDNYLKRYEKALKSIVKCENRFEECLHFIKVHKLFKEALKLFDKQSVEYKAICESFGEFLFEKRCYSEAGIMFQRCENLQQALNMYKLCFNWRNCLSLARRMHYGLVEYNTLCRNLVEDLKIHGNFNDAGTILIEDLENYEEAIDVLTDGKLWSDALRHIYSINRLDLIETHVKPKALQYFDTLMLNIDTTSEQFKKQKERLAVVRNEKIQKKINYQNEYGGGDGVMMNNISVDSDLYSDTASVVSKSSLSSKSSTSSFKSFRSSKNRRKHERKQHSLKEGSKYEDIALIRSLHQLITNTLQLRNEVHNLCTILMHFDEDTVAEKLQNSLSILLKFIKESENEIWSQDLLLNMQQQQNDVNNLCYGPNMTSNSVSQALQNSEAVGGDQSQMLEPQFRYPPEHGTLHWKLFTLN